MNTSLIAAITVATLFGIAGAAVTILYGAEATLRRVRHWRDDRRDGPEP